jgi:hypothetical protein
VDGRDSNVEESRRRHRKAEFGVANAEDLPVSQLGVFDLVLCFGLLYHLENPFQAIRKMATVTRKVLFIESMCVHGTDPRVEILDEVVFDNQGLNYVALCPSEPAFVKMLYCSGFPFVYTFRNLPNHPLYRSSAWRRRMRTMLLASHVELVGVSGIDLAKDRERVNTTELNVWLTPLGNAARNLRAALRKLKR